MADNKKSPFDRWMDKKVANVVDTSSEALSQKFKIYLTAFYFVAMLVFVTFSMISLNEIGKVSNVLLYIFGGLFYAVFVVMAGLSIWGILQAGSGTVSKLDGVNKMYITSKILRRILGLVTYIITVFTLFQTWGEGIEYRLFTSIMLIAFSVGNLWIVVSDIYEKRLAQERERRRLEEIEAKKNASIKNKMKKSAEKISQSVTSALKNSNSAVDLSVSEAREKIKEELDAWESKIFDVLNACYDKAIEGIPKVEEPVKEVSAKYMLKYGNIDKAISKYVSYQITKCGTSGFVTGLGGWLTLPVAVPANLASVIYMQLRTITTIATMYGHDVEDESVRTLAYACLTGSAMTDILKSVGIEPEAGSVFEKIDSIPIAVLSKINKKVCVRFATKAGEKGFANFAKFIPLLGGVIGGTVDVVATRVIASNAKIIFGGCVGDTADVILDDGDSIKNSDVIEIKADDFEW
ncbi:MAG: EcsC family protein [Bacillota bacterium]